MIVNIQAPKTVSDQIYIMIREKMQKLDTFFDAVVHADVHLQEEKKNPVKGKIVKIKLAIPGPDIFAIDRSDTYEKAFARALSDIRKQLIKQKEERFTFN